jgi:phenylalanyl-tRNA synthetase beta chain
VCVRGDIATEVIMLLPISWLSEFIDIELDVESLAHELTMRGTEVEALHEHRVSGVVVGRVLACERHPDADRLTVCTVDIGRGEPSTIVCGAPNVAAGQRVAVAPPGAELPGGFKIKARKMRGVLSAGMILAEDELGIGDDHDGILVIAEEYPVGSDLGEHIPLTDTVLELSVTPNRGDCLSLYGIARELHAFTGAPIYLPPMIEDRGDAAGDASVAGGVAERIQVDLQDPQGAPRYLARVVEGVAAARSPLLWRTRLHRAGLRAINAIVDATNITLLELGQPQHAFDLRHFPSGLVKVRPARAGEEFVTLDGDSHTLPEGVVMIASDEKAVAIAGVMGGLDSAVTEETRDLLLESAYFDPSAVRRARTQLRMQSESAFRFERGVDPERVPDAAARTAWLIAEHTGGQVVPGVVDAYPRPVAREALVLRQARMARVLGYSVPVEDVTRILDRLELAPRFEDGASPTWRVQVPSHRHDLEREIDLIEEVARIYGYDQIPEASGLAGPAPGGPSAADQALRSIERALIGLGYAGTAGNTLLSPDDLQALRLDGEEQVRPIRLGNPTGADQSLLRPSLLPSLLASIERNRARGLADLRLFEVGKVFADRGGRHERGAEERFVERHVLTLVVTGKAAPLHWSDSPREVDFFDMRGHLEHLLESLRAPRWEFVAGAAAPFLAPEPAASLIMGGEEIGWLGQLDRGAAKRWDLEETTVLVAHLEIDRLVPLLSGERRFVEPSRFPASRRDLSMIVPAGVSFAQLETTIRGAARRQLRSVEVFDVYAGKPLAAGERSVALRLTYRAQDRTLTDDEIRKSQERVIRALEKEHGVRIRGA